MPLIPRKAAQTGTTSPKIGDSSIKAQADQARSDAAFYRQASSDALLSGDISAAAGVAKAVAGLGSLGGTPTDGMGLSLTTTGGLY